VTVGKVQRPQATIIIAFYNDLELLRKILSALSLEKNYHFEVIVADDGSSDDVVFLLPSVFSEFMFEIKHLWQEDLGFRKPLVLNKAVVAASSEVLIFLDGDCVPQRGFLDGHLHNRVKPECRAGRRVDLAYELIRKLDMREPANILKFNPFRLLRGFFKGEVERLEKSIRLPRWLVSLGRGRSRSIVGCNFSIDRDVILSINGFDTRANFPWGAEDADIERRLRSFGVPITPMHGASTVFHFDKNFYRREAPLEDKGLIFFNKVTSDGETITSYGIERLEERSGDAA